MIQVAFTALVGGNEHTIRADVAEHEGETLVAFCDLAHLQDLAETHGLDESDLKRIEAKAVETFRLKRMAGAVRERMASP